MPEPSPRPVPGTDAPARTEPAEAGLERLRAAVDGSDTEVAAAFEHAYRRTALAAEVDGSDTEVAAALEHAHTRTTLTRDQAARDRWLLAWLEHQDRADPALARRVRAATCCPVMQMPFRQEGPMRPVVLGGDHRFEPMNPVSLAVAETLMQEPHPVHPVTGDPVSRICEYPAYLQMPTVVRVAVLEEMRPPHAARAGQASRALNRCTAALAAAGQVLGPVLAQRTVDPSSGAARWHDPHAAAPGPASRSPGGAAPGLG